jgi:hypothetical protein
VLRLRFPFSLIAAARHPSLAHTGLNQIRPAWVLACSPYTVSRLLAHLGGVRLDWRVSVGLPQVLRNEKKFTERSKARRHRTTWPIFRPAIINLMVDAVDRRVMAERWPTPGTV